MRFKKIFFLLGLLVLACVPAMTHDFSQLPKDIQIKMTSFSDAERLRFLKNYSWENRYNMPTMAFEAAKCAIEIAENIDDINSKIECYNYIGIINTHLDNYDMALEYFGKSKKLAIEHDNIFQLAHSYNNIGRIYLEKENYDKALENTEKSLTLMKKVADTLGMSYNYSQYSRIFLALGKNQKAEYYADLVIKFGKKVINKEMVCRGAKDLGDVYMKEGKYQEALDTYFAYFSQEAIDTGVEIEIAAAYEKIGNYDKAYDFAVRGYNSSEMRHSSQDMYDALLLIYRSVDKSYKKDEAAKIFKRVIELSDSLNSSRNVRRFYSMQNSSKLKLQERRNEEIQKESKNQRFLLLMLGFIVVLMMVFAINKNINYRKMKKINKSLEEETDKNMKQAEDLREALATKDKFFSIIAHDLKNPLGSFRDLSNMLYNQFDILSEDEKKEYILMMKNSTKGIFELLQNLLEWSRAERGLIKYTPEEVNIGFIAENCVNLLSIQAKDKNISLFNRIQKEQYVTGDANLLTTIIRNLVSNSIKFTNKDGNIVVGKCGDNIAPDGFDMFFVKDDGVGMSKEISDNLFNIAEKKKSKVGTKGETGTGLGLILCKDFVELHGGKISVESTEGKGSTFYFTVPKK